MRAIVAAVALLTAVPAVAQDAAAPAQETATPAAAAQDSAGPMTASAAKRARYLQMADKRGADIDQVIAGDNDSIAGVRVIFDGRFVTIPGSTVSAGSRPSALKTSMSGKDVGKLP
jgi:hypothetical protein